MDNIESRLFKRNKENAEKQYWIDTEGKVHKYNGDLSISIISIHWEIANELFPDINNPDRYMEKMGWILVGSSVYDCPITKKEPTQSQINTLDRLSLLQNLCVLDGGYYIKYKLDDNI